MSNTFDPDKYLSEKESSPEFNPDVYLSEKEPQEAPSQIESALRGAGQGASFGTIDELLGAIGGGEGSLTGAGKEILSKFGADYEGDADVAAYKEARDLERAKNKAAEEENPTTYMLGELGAGLATIPLGGGLLKGAGLAAKATQGTSATAQALAEAPVLSKIMEGVKTGATFGAAQGLGSSEEESLGGIGSDVLSSSAMGGALGGVLSGVGAGISKATEGLKSSKMGKRLSTLSEAVSKGEETTPEAINKEVTSVSEDLLSSLKKNKSNKSDAYNKIVDKIDNQEGAGTVTDLNKLISSIYSKIDEVGDISKQGQELKTLVNDIEQTVGKKMRSITPEGKVITELGKTDLNAAETLKLKNLVNKLRNEQQDLSHSTGQYMGEVTEDLLENLQNVDPSAKEAVKSADIGYKSAMDAFRQLGIKIPEAGDDVDVQRKALERVRSTLMGFNPEDIGGNAMSRIEGSLSELRKSDPDKARDLLNKIQSLSKRVDLAEATTQEGINKGVLSTQSAYLKGARFGLESTKAVKDVGAAIGQDLYKMAPEQLQQMATKIGGAVGTTLQKISEAAPSTRNALLFTALQRPGFREALKGNHEEQP